MTLDELEKRVNRALVDPMAQPEIGEAVKIMSKLLAVARAAKAHLHVWERLPFDEMQPSRDPRFRPNDRLGLAEALAALEG